MELSSVPPPSDGAEIIAPPRAEIDRALQQAVQHHSLGAFLHLDHRAASRPSAEVDLPHVASPLRGLPLAVKDNIAVAGMPLTAGTAGMRGYIAQRDADCVALLKRAGMCVIGKTALHELSMGFTSANAAFGRVRNAIDPDRTPGGSSGGSAVAVAVGAASIALGTDTNGSIRIPAAFNGVFGFRPSNGRYSTDGVVPLAPSLDTVGLLARQLDELVHADNILATLSRADRRVSSSPTSPAEDIRLGVVDSAVETASEIVRDAFEETMTRLRLNGISLVPVYLPDAVERGRGAVLTVLEYESARALRAYFQTHIPERDAEAIFASAEPDVRAALAYSAHADVDAYSTAQSHLRECQEAFGLFLRAHRLNALVQPPSPIHAPKHDPSWRSPAPSVLQGGQVFSPREAYGYPASLATSTGAPSLVMPFSEVSHGLSSAIELIGEVGADEQLLRLGQRFWQ